MLSLIFAPRVEVSNYESYHFLWEVLNYLRLDVLFAEFGLELWFWVVAVLITLVVPVASAIISQFYNKSIEYYFIQVPIYLYKDLLVIPLTYSSLILIRYGITNVQDDDVYLN
jgi:hypothetical protein